jgi:serine/threonine protein kinase
MTATDSFRCPRCGTPRATALDLCPTCLIATALAVEEDPCPYQVMSPIAQDGRGVTYLALALTGARGYVALKVHGRRDDTEVVLSRYHEWKPALARLRHPSVSKLLDVGLTAEGLLYVATEYVGGWPLTTIGSHPSVGVAERALLVRQLIGAVDAAHALGVVHLKLDVSKVKISTANGPHAMILGFGSSLILDGAEAHRLPDVLSLIPLVRELGVKLPDRPYGTAAAILDALPSSI